MEIWNNNKDNQQIDHILILIHILKIVLIIHLLILVKINHRDYQVKLERMVERQIVQILCQMKIN